MTPEASARIAAKVGFRLGPEGSAAVCVLDFERSPPQKLEGSSASADCTFSIDDVEDLARMTRGELTPTAALLAGRLKVDGNLSIAMRAERALWPG